VGMYNLAVCICAEREHAMMLWMKVGSSLLSLYDRMIVTKPSMHTGAHTGLRRGAGGGSDSYDSKALVTLNGTALRAAARR